MSKSISESALQMEFYMSPALSLSSEKGSVIIATQSFGGWQPRCWCHPDEALRENIYWPFANTSTCVTESGRQKCVRVCQREKETAYIYWPPAATAGEELFKCWVTLATLCLNGGRGGPAKPQPLDRDLTACNYGDMLESLECVCERKRERQRDAQHPPYDNKGILGLCNVWFVYRGVQ